MTGIFFSSCASFTKRHYNKGYHITRHSSIPQRTSSEKEIVTESEVKKNIPLVASEKNNLAVKQDAVQYAAKENNPTITAMKQSNHTAVSESESVETRQKETVFKNPVATIKKGIKDVRSAASNDHGHSLLWIIVVVILILWAIGFLADGFGLGGLIHVLLVIALILFILWLLRVL